jgi:hypothetical protein
MIPIVAGLLMGAAMGGGIAALQKKDILQGALMGGVGGALGGAFMPAAGGLGGAAAESSLAGTLAGEAGVQSLAQGSLGEAMKVGALDPVMLESGTSGLQGAAMEVGGLGIKPGIATGAIPPTTTGGVFGNLGGSGGIGNFLSQNKYALAGGVAGGMLAPGQEEKPADQGNIYTTQFSQEQNPNFGAPGEDYFSKQAYAPGTITPVKDYKPTQFAANGGIIALAEGGGLETQRYSQPTRQVAPEVAAYNARMMEMANQQYNVNPRPAPMQVPGSAGYMAPIPRMAAPAPTEDSISGLRFNPVTQQFEGTFAAPGKKKDSEMFGDGMYRDRSYFGDSAGDVGSNDMGDDAPGDTTDSGIGDANLAYGGSVRYNQGGLSSLGSYSDGGQLLRGPGDGVSDDIPARIGRKQPARLADGEFVVPARVVSELGNGSTDAGAKQLYAMMDRVQKNRKKSIGKGKVAVDAKSRKLLPA